MQTYSELSQAGFTGFTPEKMKDVAYFEQLATQTQTDMSAWPLVSLLEASQAGNRRSLNQIFFNYLTQVEKAKADPLEDPKVKEALPQIVAMLANKKKQHIEYIKDNQSIALDEANQYARNMHTKLRQAREFALQAENLKDQPDELMASEIKLILQNPFWKFKDVTGNFISFTTATPVVMSERNTQAGIDRTINFGRLSARLDPIQAELKVLKYEKNILCSNVYHPYVSDQGHICWGNASETALRILTQGKFGQAFGLLAALLMTYSPDATPYRRLQQFEDTLRQLAAAPAVAQTPLGTTLVPGASTTDTSSGSESEDDDDSDRCGGCDRHVENCWCHFCEICEDRYYPDHCPDHWCTICETYNEGECGCCHDCSQIADECTRCHECGRHGDHTPNCVEHPNNQL